MVEIRWTRLKEAWKTFWLDVKTIPLLYLKLRGKKQEYAERHLEKICANCPQSRKKTRDVKGDGTCWWYENWSQGNYDIPSDFGVINWLRFYTGNETNLERYNEEKEG